jgi:hypothetical protein
VRYRDEVVSVRVPAAASCELTTESGKLRLKSPES